jgi:hypothetical protein
MKSGWFCTVPALAAVLLAASASLSSLRADLYVLESTDAGIKPGTRFTPGESITIPAGGQIRAVLPSGKTRTIKGPYTGTVADLTKGQTTNEGVMVWIRNILQTGGASEATPGATRSIARPAQPKPTTVFSWDSIPVTVNGDVCVEKGAKLQLIRAPSSRVERATVVDVSSTARGEVQWQPGSERVVWPQGVEVRPDGTYYLQEPDRPRRQITLRVLDSLPGEDEILSELQKRGCKYQFEAWVREKLLAKR